jgi:hypothetical protein
MATPLINGINYSWANITLVLFGVPVVGITKIEYKRKQKKENNYGFGSQPVSRGYGNYEYEGSIEIYQDEWKRICAAAPNGDPLLIPPFEIQVVYSGRGIVADKDRLKAVEFAEDNFTANQGDTKLMVSVPLVIGLIERGV